MLYNTFIENSKLNSLNINEFNKQLNNYSRQKDILEPALHYPYDTFLFDNLPLDNLMNLMLKRKSNRIFSNKKISLKKVGKLLSAFVMNKDKLRTIPSAGARNPIEVFCLVNNGEEKINEKIFYYNFDNHSISFVNNLNKYDDYKNIINLDSSNTIPQIIVVFLAFPERTLDKYDERGGRFILIECGQFAQNLSLRIVKEHMIGVELGGILDDEMLQILNLHNTSAQVLLGYAVGYKGDV